MITGEETPWPAWGAGNREGVRVTEPHIKNIGVNDQRTGVHVDCQRVYSAVRKWLRQPLLENIMR